MAVLSKFKCGITKENNFKHYCESTSLSRDKVSRSKVLGSSSLDIDNPKENNFTHYCESTSLSRDKVSRSKVLGSSSLDIDKSICSGGRTGVPDICMLARVPKPSDIN